MCHSSTSFSQRGTRYQLLIRAMLFMFVLSSRASVAYPSELAADDVALNSHKVLIRCWTSWHLVFYTGLSFVAI